MAHVEIDGARLWVEERGSGPPVLMVHGTGGYSGLFRPLAEQLASSHRAIAYDRRGFGQSGSEPAEAFHRHAEDAGRLLSALDAEPAGVVAWSAGGEIGLDLAVTYPERVAWLVLLEPAHQLLVHPSLSTMRMTATANYRSRLRGDPAGGAAALYRWASRYTSGGNAFDAYPEEWREAMLAHAPRTMTEMDQVLAFRIPKKRLGTISSPTIVAVGELAEPVFARAARRLGRTLPQARLVKVRGSSHMLPTDAPEEIAGIVREMPVA